MPLPRIITDSRMALARRSRFYAGVALGQRWVEDPGIGTLCTDGETVWFNAAYCESRGVEETMGLMVHEILHTVHKHHLREGDRDHAEWNIAADLAINDPIRRDGYKLPDELWFDTTGEYAFRTAEYIYGLRQDGKQRPQPGQGGTGKDGKGEDASSGQAGGRGQPGAGRHCQGRPGTERLASEDGPAAMPGEVRRPKAADGKPMEAAELARAGARTDRIVQRAADMARRAGQGSAGLDRMVAASASRVDWRDRFATSLSGMCSTRACHSRPNRRFVQAGIILPSTRRHGPQCVAYVMDTSGSIGMAEHRAHLGVARSMLEDLAPRELLVIQCDTEVRRVDSLQPGDSLDEIKLAGGGGTLFVPAFEWIAEHADADAIVYATDLASSDRPEDPGVQTIWLTPRTNRLAPFGETIVIDAIH